MRIKIIKNLCFKKTALKRLPLKIILFFLVFNLYSVLSLNPVFCAQDNSAQKTLAAANKQVALDKKALLQKEREEKLAQKKAAAEAKEKANILKKAKLQKERDEKIAKERELKALRLPKDTSDYITIKVRPLNEVLVQAQLLLKNGKYEDALATYNYAYDIAKDRAVKNDILKKKSDIKGIMANREQERLIAEKKSLQDVKQSVISAKKAQLQKERDEKIAKEKSAAEAEKKAALAKKELLRKEREQKIAEKNAIPRLKKEMTALRKEQLTQERKRKLAERRSAAEAKRKARLAEKAKLQKKQKEKEARDIENAPLESSPIAEYMCETGISAYEAGDYQTALAEFDKVLLVEPNNRVAKKYIKSALDKTGQVKSNGAK